jgi:predicted nucleic acid-binding protein
MDCFDADALIHAAIPGHPLGQRMAALFQEAGPDGVAGAGSVLLLAEVLAKPLRHGSPDEVRILAGLLARLDLRPVDRAIAELATALSSRYRLRAADATHLATAVGVGADRFIANNQGDFSAAITEIRYLPRRPPRTGYLNTRQSSVKQSAYDSLPIITRRLAGRVSFLGACNR